MKYLVVFNLVFLSLGFMELHEPGFMGLWVL